MDSPPQSLTYEEIVKVVACAIAKLYIDWPAEKQDACPKIKLDMCFLRMTSQPSRLHFFPDLHTEVLRSWDKL